MREIDQEILNYLQDHPGDPFTSQEVTDTIDSNYTKGHIHKRLNYLLESRNDIEEDWQTDSTFGYWFDGNFVPANRASLESFLRNRVAENVAELTMSHLRDLAEREADNAASLTYEEKLFVYVE